MLRLPISDPKNTRISRILSGTVPLSLVVRQQKSELLRVFRPLPQMPQGETVALRHSATPEHTADATLIKVLQEQLQQANEREQQAREREVHLLALLETAQQVLQAEQQARRELETKLLPAPRPAPVSKFRARTLLAVLVALLVFAGWHFRAVIVSARAS